MDDNCYINNKLSYKFLEKKYRQDRLDDLTYLQKVLIKVSRPKIGLTISKKNIGKWIKAHPVSFQGIARKIMNTVTYISFDDFNRHCKKMMKTFNNTKKKCIIVVGAVNLIGSSKVTVNIEKSNFWMIVLYWKYLKPYDVLFNLDVAIDFYNQEEFDFVILDDCLYSGDQMVDNIIENSSSKLLVSYNRKNSVSKIIFNKKCNLHILVPYISTYAYEKLNIINLQTKFNIKTYAQNIIRPIEDIVSSDDRIILYKIQNQINYSVLDKFSIVFQHKLADDISSIYAILNSGKLLTGKSIPTKITNQCTNIYEKECFIPPYKEYINLILKKKFEM